MGDLKQYDLDLRRLLFEEKAADQGRLCAKYCDKCWIPCEAIPSMIASPLQTLRRMM
jgi:hypothetical protein